MGSVEMSLIGWVLIWSVFGWVKMGCIRSWGGAKQVLYKYGLGWVGVG